MNFFAQPDLLLVIPLILGVLILVYLNSRKVARERLSQLIASKLLSAVIPHFSRKREGIKIAFFFAGMIFLLLSLAGPQWGFSKRTVSPRGIDLLIAVDLSKSMLARDVRPNRLERVKLTLSNLLEKVKGDRLGLIAFSGSAFLQCPLTLDHQAFVKTLDELKVGLIPRPGTNLARPIQEAERSFSKDDTDKFLVLISDGEDLEGQGLMQAKEAAKKGIRIFTIGIGSDQGARIPTDPLNQSPQNFLKDRAGTEILTKLDANALIDIARTTGGQYLPIGPTGEGLTHVFSELQAFGQKKLREQLSTTLPINRYQIFVILGILFLVIENLSPSSKKNILKSATKCFPVAIFLMFGCSQPDNTRRAEEATLKGNHLEAARLYSNEIDSLKDGDNSLKVLRLNAGLSYLQAGSFPKAEEFLQATLEQSTDDPEIQSKAINALGNLFYAKANSFLDQQNVNEARKSWEKAREFYSAASQIDANPLAEKNLDSLNDQIQNRIESLVSKIQGLVWRDINGNGKREENEPLLKARIFWDKNDDGEHNESLEPAIPGNEMGQFAFEWISGIYPTSLKLASIIPDQNESSPSILLPLFPPPPPPFEASGTRNHLVEIDKPGSLFIPMPWRAAPSLNGIVWNDSNIDGKVDDNESGSTAATLFIDKNGNFQLDDNETSFKPSDDGKFSQIVPPGQYSLCIKPDNPDANVTYPIEEHKAYLTWVDFEQSSKPMFFGIQDRSEGNSSSESSPQNNPNPERIEEDEENKEAKTPSTEEVNALYERLLQETESKSEPLENDIPNSNPVQAGRDY